MPQLPAAQEGGGVHKAQRALSAANASRHSVIADEQSQPDASTRGKSGPVSGAVMGRKPRRLRGRWSRLPGGRAIALYSLFRFRLWCGRRFSHGLLRFGKILEG